MEEEIDLRQYVEVLLKYKFWIIGLAILAAVVAFVVGSMQPARYQAEASLAMLRVRSEVALEPKFQTLSEDDLQLRTDLKSRRETLATLAESSSVAAAVLQQLGDQLRGIATSLEKLQGLVNVDTDGDLILLKVRDGNPQLAADIANAWAEQAEAYINSIYGQPLLPVQELQTQLEGAQDRYKTAQRELEAFLAENRIPELEREVKHRRDLTASYQETLTSNEAALYNKALDTERQILSGYYDELASIERVLTDARALQRELEQTGSAAATEWAQALALIGVQNRAFGVDGQQLQVILSGEAPATQLQDLNQLVTVLEEKAESVRTAISGKEQQLFDVGIEGATPPSGNPLSQRIQSLTSEMVELQAELEAEQARERELTRSRDLAWETFQTIARKLAENEIEVQALGSEVRLASPALKPERPMPRGRLLNTAVAGMLGLMAGVFGAFVVEWWRQESPATSPSSAEIAEQ